MTVAERGRLPAEVRAAYAAAKSGPAERTKSASSPSSNVAAPPAKRPVIAETAEDTDAVPVAPRANVALKPLSLPVPAPSPQVSRSEPPPSRPSPRPEPDVSDRIAVLETQLAALTDRVAQLESSPPVAAKPSRFRRRSS